MCKARLVHNFVSHMCARAQTDGKIAWEYDIHSVTVDLYPVRGRIAIEVLCVVLLLLNCLSELSGNVYM